MQFTFHAGGPFPGLLLYIDPGTGSMLFALFVGLISAAYWLLRGWLLKLRFFFTGGRKTAENTETLPLVVFSDDKRYFRVFEPILQELDRRGTDMVYLTMSKDDPGLSADLPHLRGEYIGEGSLAFAKLNRLDADLVFATTPGLDVYQWKRSKKVRCYVHLLHAPVEVALYRMFGLDYYDAVMLSGAYQERDERDLERLRNLPAKELPMIGIPYMDEMAKRLAAAEPLPAHETTVLVAPSWGETSLFGKYGGRILDILLQTDYHIIVRPHPQSFASEKELMDRLMQAYPASDRLEWNRDTDNFECLRRSDIMISDFSGVIFDFALIYDKPVIYADTVFDGSPYDICWLDRPLWTFTALERFAEKLPADALDNLPQLIARCLSEENYAEGRRAVREETWCNPGEGAVRAADYLSEKLEELRAAREAAGQEKAAAAVAAGKKTAKKRGKRAAEAEAQAVEEKAAKADKKEGA